MKEKGDGLSVKLRRRHRPRNKLVAPPLPRTNNNNQLQPVKRSNMNEEKKKKKKMVAKSNKRVHL
jgi:hypothetical protein